MKMKVIVNAPEDPKFTPRIKKAIFELIAAVIEKIVEDLKSLPDTLKDTLKNFRISENLEKNEIVVEVDVNLIEILKNVMEMAE